MRQNKMKKICFKDFEFLNLFLEYIFFKCYFFWNENKICNGNE